MIASGGAADSGYKELARKYGLAAAALIVNNFFVAYVLSTLFSAAISVFPNAPELADISTDAGYLLLLILNEICAYAFPIAAYCFLFRGSANPPADSPSGYKRFFGETPLIFFTGWLFASSGAVVTNFISIFMERVFGVPQAKEAFSSAMPTNAFTFAVFAFCTCIIAPVCEELIYRRLLLRPMKKYSDSAAVLITSLLFALSHFNLNQFLYTFAFGYFLAVIAIRSRSVIPCIVCHILNNTVAGIDTYLPDTLGNEEADKVFRGIFSAIETASPYILLVAIPAAAVVLILRLYRLHDKGGQKLSYRLAAAFSDPVVIVPTAIMFILAIVKLYN